MLLADSGIDWPQWGRLETGACELEAGRAGDAPESRALDTDYLRLPQHLLESIKKAANSTDVAYQSLIKVWLREKLHGS
jgi:hypothetical protein